MAGLRGTYNRGPVAHIAKVPLTEDERAQLETIAILDRTSHAETFRRALREYAERRQRRGAR